VINTLEAQVGHFLQVLSESGHFREITRFPGWLPAAFFLQNVLQLQQQRSVIICVDSLALWNIINEEDEVLILKNWGVNFSSRFLYLEFLGAGWAPMPTPATPLIVDLSLHHSDTTRFRPWTTFTIGNSKVAHTTGNVDVLICIQAFQNPLRRQLPRELWTQPAHVRCPLAQLLIYLKSGGLPRLAHEFYQ
jgi:hypothetical protein